MLAESGSDAPPVRARAQPSRGPVGCKCAVAHRDYLCQVYNEEAFRYLLAVERSRAAQLQRSFLLLLVSTRRPPFGAGRIAPDLAAGVFAALSLSIRDIDFIGWFREGRVAGAVLTQAQPATAEVSRHVGSRVSAALARRLPRDLAASLQLRVLQLRAPPDTHRHGEP